MTVLVADRVCVQDDRSSAVSEQSASSPERTVPSGPRRRGLPRRSAHERTVAVSPQVAPLAAPLGRKRKRLHCRLFLERKEVCRQSLLQLLDLSHKSFEGSLGMMTKMEQNKFCKPYALSRELNFLK